MPLYTYVYTLPEANIAPEKWDGRKIRPSFWDFAYFQGAFAVGFREGT